MFKVFAESISACNQMFFSEVDPWNCSKCWKHCPEGILQEKASKKSFQNSVEMSYAGFSFWMKLQAADLFKKDHDIGVFPWRFVLGL